jgi:hypothetical protein
MSAAAAGFQQAIGCPYRPYVSFSNNNNNDNNTKIYIPCLTELSRHALHCHKNAREK